MRIRRYAQFLAQKHQDDASPPQQKKEETLRDENNERVIDGTVAMVDDLREAKPIGDIVRVSEEGRKKRNHFASFEYDGNRYNIEDSVMFWAGIEKKPYVAIIKDITQSIDQSMMVTVQWFYRPEDTEKKGGGNWKSSDTRELFYSFHQDEIPIESIMHKCVVLFIPLDKQIPYRKQHPGFIVQNVYDTEQKRLFKFTDKVYVKNKRKEIDFLIRKTMSQVGELPDIDKKNQWKNKRILGKRKHTAQDISRA